MMPRIYGHKQGMDVLVRTVNDCMERGIEYLTIFAFSSENWKRPQEEVSALMGLVLIGVSKYLGRMAGDGVRVRVIGDRQAVSDRVRAAWDHAEVITKDNHRLTLSVAFNYGGRWDVVQACKRAMVEGVDPQDLDERKLGTYMSLAHTPDPDLFIRTGGEVRLSNFLLWQVAYAELYFTDCLWPDFNADVLGAALRAYASRDRRFGGVKLDDAVVSSA